MHTYLDNLIENPHARIKNSKKRLRKARKLIEVYNMFDLHGVPSFYNG